MTKDRSYNFSKSKDNDKPNVVFSKAAPYCRNKTLRCGHSNTIIATTVQIMISMMLINYSTLLTSLKYRFLIWVPILFLWYK